MWNVGNFNAKGTSPTWGWGSNPHEAIFINITLDGFDVM